MGLGGVFGLIWRAWHLGRIADKSLTVKIDNSLRSSANFRHLCKTCLRSEMIVFSLSSWSLELIWLQILPFLGLNLILWPIMLMIVIWASRILIGYPLIRFCQKFFPWFSLISVGETWRVNVMRMTPIFCILRQFPHLSLILNQTMPSLLMILTHWLGRICLQSRRFFVIFLNICQLDLDFGVDRFKAFLALFWRTLFEFWRHLEHSVHLVQFELALIILPTFWGQPIVHLQRLGTPTCSTCGWSYLLLIACSTFS